MEKYIKINGLETHYIITSKGEVINTKTNKKLKINNMGMVQLTINSIGYTKRVARLVAEAFIPNPDITIYIYVINIDGNKLNNCIENIKWITAKENSENTWNKRRQKNHINKKSNKIANKNIVEKTEKFIINKDEKRILIDGEETPYVITKTGQIRNLRTGNILKGSILASYPTINLRWDGKQKTKSIHRLVAEVWIPNPNHLPYVDHIDGDRLNFNVENLRWVTEKENANNIHLDKTPKKIPDTRPILTDKELKEEIWLEYNNSGYKISNMGRIAGKRKDFLDGKSLDCGYRSYTIQGKTILGHILVWETFNGPKPKNMVINHINGNKMDNRLTNLELVTQQENMKKASIDENAWNFRKVIELDDNNTILREFKNASEAARAIGILPGSMRNSIRRNGKCYNGLKYRYIEN